MVKIKTTDKGKKYVKIGKKRTYLPTLLKRVNIKRLQEGRKPYKSIGQRNIENILMQLIEAKKTEKKKLKKVKRRRGRKGKIPQEGIRQKLQEATLKIKQLEAQLQKEKDEKQKEQLQQTIKETQEALEEQKKLLLEYKPEPILEKEPEKKKKENQN